MRCGARRPPADTVLEIGPGEGALTRPLAARARLRRRRRDRSAARRGARGRVRARGQRPHLPGRRSRAALPASGSRARGRTPATRRCSWPTFPTTSRPRSSSRPSRTARRSGARSRPSSARSRGGSSRGPGRTTTGTSRCAPPRTRPGRILFDLPPGAFRPRPKVMSSVLELTPRAGGARRRTSCAAPCASPRSASTRGARRSPTRSSSAAPARALGERPRGARQDGDGAGRGAVARGLPGARARAGGPWRERVAPLEVVPLGGVGEFGRNVLWLRVRGLEHPRGRRRLVSRRELSRDRPHRAGPLGAPRRADRRRLPDARPRGPRRRAVVPARVVPGARVRLSRSRWRSRAGGWRRRARRSTG